MIKVVATSEIQNEILNSGYDVASVYSSYYVNCSTVAAARKIVKTKVAIWLYTITGNVKLTEVNRVLKEFKFITY